MPPYVRRRTSSGTLTIGVPFSAALKDLSVTLYFDTERPCTTEASHVLWQKNLFTSQFHQNLCRNNELKAMNYSESLTLKGWVIVKDVGHDGDSKTHP